MSKPKQKPKAIEAAYKAIIFDAKDRTDILSALNTLYNKAYLDCLEEETRKTSHQLRVVR